MSLKNVLQKRKKRKEMDDGNISGVFEVFNQLIEEKFNKRFDELTKGIEDKVISKTDSYLGTVKKGDSGYTPRKGRDYFDGEKGDKGDSPTSPFLTGLIKPLIPEPLKGGKGDPGDKGNDGSPDKPEDIVKKLNTLNDVLDVKVLKGLKPILRSIQDSMRAIKKGIGKEGGMKGGGMGLPVHQSFDCDGATTEFTLSNNVAANGQAAWIYYQGQFLVNSTHWSISGKTLTLTFTPEDETVIDITFIRSS